MTPLSGISSEAQQQARAASGPLEGMVVIDLTRVLSGPYATMLLGDLGATVIKVENPRGGDTTRHSAPFKRGQSPYFLSVNRNKKSLALDLAADEGRDIVRTLCQTADVLIENFRPGTLPKMGLAPEKLWATNPGLVVCSISGFGQTGPLRDRIAYDVITQAMSGVISVNGEPDGPPVRLSIPVGDLTGGMLADIGILAALVGRDRGRGGRYVDFSLHDGLISMLGYMATLYDVSGRAPGRVGSRHHTIVPYGTFRTKDGFLALAVFTTRFWEKFSAAIGRADLGADPRFRKTSDRMRNRVDLERMIEEILAERTTAEWADLFEDADVPASPILSIDEALEHPHTASRGMFPTLSHPSYGEVRVPGPPLRLGGAAAAQPAPPPLLGEHSVEILRDRLGFDPGEIERLIGKGIAATPESAAPDSVPAAAPA